MSSAKCCSFRLGLNVLKPRCRLNLWQIVIDGTASNNIELKSINILGFIQGSIGIIAWYYTSILALIEISLICFWTKAHHMTE